MCMQARPCPAHACLLEAVRQLLVVNPPLARPPPPRACAPRAPPSCSGADAILLIAAVLPNQDLEYFMKAAEKMDMTCLIEVGVCSRAAVHLRGTVSELRRTACWPHAMYKD